MSEVPGNIGFRSSEVGCTHSPTCPNTSAVTISDPSFRRLWADAPLYPLFLPLPPHIHPQTASPLADECAVIAVKRRKVPRNTERLIDFNSFSRGAIKSVTTLIKINS